LRQAGEGRKGGKSSFVREEKEKKKGPQSRKREGGTIRDLLFRTSSNKIQVNPKKKGREARIKRLLPRGHRKPKAPSLSAKGKGERRMGKPSAELGVDHLEGVEGKKIGGRSHSPNECPEM